MRDGPLLFMHIFSVLLTYHSEIVYTSWLFRVPVFRFHATSVLFSSKRKMLFCILLWPWWSSTVKELSIEINTEKKKYIFMFHQQIQEQNYSIRTDTKSLNLWHS